MDEDAIFWMQRTLLELSEIQLQLQALMMADLEAIAAQVLALHPSAPTKSRELNAQFSEIHAQALERARAMIESLRQRLAAIQTPKT